MAVEAVVDSAALLLLDALEAVRATPAPAGLEAERLGVLAHASAELQGVYLRDLGLVDAAALGARGPADLLHDTAGIPVWQARRDAGLARRLATIPGLAEAVAGGGLELPAALLLVRAWQGLPGSLQTDELARALVVFGGSVSLQELRSKVEELLGALAPDVTDADLADARDNGSLELRDVGSQTVGELVCDRLTGEWLREVLQCKTEADRRTGPDGSPDPRSPGKQNLDALIACLDVAVQSDVVPGDPRLVIVTTVDDLTQMHEPRPDRVDPADAVADLFEGTDLVAQDDTSDTDTDTHAGVDADASGRTTASGVDAAVPTRRRPSWSTCTRGGVPVGPRTLAALACTSTLTRLVLSPLGDPVDSSADRRQLNRAQRRALEHRAGYRCQRHGCGRTARLCVPHHVDPWSLGGTSTLDNMILLCVSCHHHLHDRRQPLLLTDGRRLGPRGWLDPRPRPAAF